MPDAGQIDAAIELISRSHANFVYFFSNLKDPAWLLPLRDRGFFSAPPAPVYSEGYRHRPPWPEGETLARLAPRAPDIVGEVLRPLADSKRGVHPSVLRAALHVAPDVAAGLAESEALWLAEDGEPADLDAELLVDLARQLVASGQARSALRLMAEVLAIVETDQDDRWQPRFETRIDNSSYGQASERWLDALTPMHGIDALDFFMRLLSRAINCSVGKDVAPPIDGSDSWRPAIEDHEQNWGHDVRDDLVRAVRDAANSIVGQDSSRMDEVLKRLGRGRWNVYRRVGFDLIRRHQPASVEIAKEAVLDPANLRESRVRHEYLLLAREIFPILTDEEADLFATHVADGPGWEWLESTRALAEAGIDEATYARMEATWRRDVLAVIGDRLPPNLATILEELEAELGVSEHPQFDSYHSSWIGPTSPISAADLAGMAFDELIAFLADWDFGAGPEPGPSAEGLGRVLTEVVAADPVEFAERAVELSDLEATYVRACLSGLETAMKSGTALALEPVLVLCAAVARRDDSGEAHDLESGRDPSWGWARKQAASFVHRSIELSVLHPELASSAWETLDRLSWDPEPTPEYEETYGGTNMDPLTLSINTVRGEAMHGVVAFAAWLREHLDELDGHAELLDSVRQNLDAHLDTQRETSSAVRAVFGSRLGALAHFDQGWFVQQLPRLFPETDSRLRAATWNTYLAWTRPNAAMLRMLRPEYEHAIAQLSGKPAPATGWPAKRPDFALAEHLVPFYWWDSEGADELLDAFFWRASNEVAAHAVSFVGRSIDRPEETVPPEVVERLKALWRRIASRYGTPESRPEVMAEFGWWFGSGVFDPGWALESLLELLRAGVKLQGSFRVFPRLAELARDRPGQALEVVQLVTANSGDRWALYGSRAEVREVLRAALDSPEREAAAGFIHALGAKGILEYRDLL